MAKERLDLSFCPAAASGMPMILSMDERRTIKSELVGIVHGECLIVQLRTTTDIPKKFFNNHTFTVRYYHAGHAYAFQAAFTGLIKKPVSLFILSYPDAVEMLDPRAYDRFACMIPACLNVILPDAGKLDFTGFINDISIGGCCFTCNSYRHSDYQGLSVGQIIDLSFQLPGEKGQTVLDAEIRSLETETDKLKINLQYTPNVNMDIQRNAVTALQHFITGKPLLAGINRQAGSQ